MGYVGARGRATALLSSIEIFLRINAEITHSRAFLQATVKSFHMQCRGELRSG